MVGMRTEQSKGSKLTSPNLRLRTSTTLWGPLLITLTNHREGAERGYEAGRAAYQQEGDISLEDAMQLYLSMPRYRPRSCTKRIVAEWQAMFLLGWTSWLLDETSRITDEESRQPTPQAMNGIR